jgi:ABC-type bacteriocin/lantibiotic exporter with double-glycine peptidase domain
MTLFFWLDNLLNAFFVKTFSKDLKSSLLKGIVHQDFLSFNKRDVGEYINMLTVNVGLIESKFINSITTLAGSSALLISTIVVLWTIEFRVVLIMTVAGLVLLLLPNLYLPWIKKRQGSFVAENGRFLDNLKEVLLGFEVLKNYPSASLGKNIFARSNDAIEKERFLLVICRETINSITMIVAFICQFSGVLSGSYFLMLGAITTGQVMAIMQLGNNVFNPLQVIANSITQIRSVKPILKEMQYFIESSEQSSKQLVESFDKITLKNLSFTYSSQQETLNHINLSFEKGKKYLILGESGSGKSTLLKVISGYFKNYNGEISINDKSYKNYQHGDFENVLNYVPQSPYLFKASLKENISMNENITEAELERQKFNPAWQSLMNEIEDINNYQYGEKGKMLSGGQMQRIGLVRGLFTEKPLVLLDEFTSSLDNHHAEELEKFVLKNNQTTVIHVTHHPKARLLNYYDQVIYMKRGEVIFKGSCEAFLQSQHSPKSFIKAM